jgi:hypothetical protein
MHFQKTVEAFLFLFSLIHLPLFYTYCIFKIHHSFSLFVNVSHRLLKIKNIKRVVLLEKYAYTHTHVERLAAVPKPELRCRRVACVSKCIEFAPSVSAKRARPTVFYLGWYRGHESWANKKLDDGFCLLLLEDPVRRTTHTACTFGVCLFSFAPLSSLPPSPLLRYY